MPGPAPKVRIPLVELKQFRVARGLSLSRLAFEINKSFGREVVTSQLIHQIESGATPNAQKVALFLASDDIFVVEFGKILDRALGNEVSRARAATMPQAE
jgi:hypothetical protein